MEARRCLQKLFTVIVSLRRIRATVDASTARLLADLSTELRAIDDSELPTYEEAVRGAGPQRRADLQRRIERAQAEMAVCGGVDRHLADVIATCGLRALPGN